MIIEFRGSGFVIEGGIAKSKSALVKDPAPGDMPKRRGLNAYCQPCVGFSSTTTMPLLMSGRLFVRSKRMWQEEYNDSLSEWEQNRRDGKRTSFWGICGQNPPSKSTSLSICATNSRSKASCIATRRWSASSEMFQEWQLSRPMCLLRHLDFNGARLSRQLRGLQGLQHLGCSTHPAIEMYQDLQTSAVRVHRAVDGSGDSGEDADTAFRGLSKHLNVSVSSTPATFSVS